MIPNRSVERVEAPSGMNGTFTVQTVDGEKYAPTIASSYRREFNPNGLNFLEIYGNDDFEDGEIKLRVFNLDHVIYYGWES